MMGFHMDARPRGGEQGESDERRAVHASMHLSGEFVVRVRGEARRWCDCDDNVVWTGCVM